MSSDLHAADQMSLKAIEESSKLDQFLLGGAAAICAYLAQTNIYQPLGFNPSTAIIGCMIVFGASAAAGFSRLHIVVVVYRLNAQMLGESNKRRRDLYDRKCTGFLRCANHLFHLRNGLLFLGMICFIAAKVWAASVCRGCIVIN